MGFFDNAAQCRVDAAGILRRYGVNQFVRMMIHLTATLRANHLGLLGSHRASCLAIESNIVAAVTQGVSHPNKLV
jgi:hypothetical protein